MYSISHHIKMDKTSWIYNTNFYVVTKLHLVSGRSRFVLCKYPLPFIVQVYMKLYIIFYLKGLLTNSKRGSTKPAVA